MHARWHILFLLTLLLFFTANGPTAAQTGPSLSINPVAQTVPPDAGAFEVRVMVDDVTTADGLGGYTLVMNYDPSVVRAVAIADSGFVGSTDNVAVCPSSAIDNDTGRLAQFCFTINLPGFSQPGPQTSEPQVLARITFEPVAEGTTALDISETIISDPQGSVLAASTSNGEVTVQPGATNVLSVEETGGAEPSMPVLGIERANGPTSLRQYIALVLFALGGGALLGATALVRRRHKSQ